MYTWEYNLVFPPRGHGYRAGHTPLDLDGVKPVQYLITLQSMEGAEENIRESVIQDQTSLGGWSPAKKHDHSIIQDPGNHGNPYQPRRMLHRRSQIVLIDALLFTL
jgi:hypothetical protein